MLASRRANKIMHHGVEGLDRNYEQPVFPDLFLQPPHRKVLPVSAFELKCSDDISESANSTQLCVVSPVSRIPQGTSPVIRDGGLGI